MTDRKTGPQPTTSRLSYRIMQRMRDLDLTQEELADRVGVSQTTISKLITGKTERSRYIHDIAEVLQTTAAYLMWGKTALQNLGKVDPGFTPGSITPTPTSTPEVVEVEVEPDPPLKRLPGMRTMEVCRVTSNTRGSATWLPTDHPKLLFSPDFFSARNLDPERCRLLLAEGYSMSPAIKDGDVVMIDTGETRITDGETYAVVIDGELYLRNVTRRPGKLVLIALYDDAPTELPGDEVDVLGRMVWRGG